jgi:hypothetical protein
MRFASLRRVVFELLRVSLCYSDFALSLARRSFRAFLFAICLTMAEHGRAIMEERLIPSLLKDLDQVDPMLRGGRG